MLKFKNMELIKNIRKYLKKEQIDYLLVNSTNEFLVEYNDLNQNSRYFLTGFSGSTGDAIISQNKIYLFVDGRYHEQADLEVDKNLVTVVKLQIGENLINTIGKKLKANKTFAIVSTKNSQTKFELLQEELIKKNIEIKLLNADPIMDLIEHKKEKTLPKYEQIDVKISGLSSNEKFKILSNKLKNDEAFFITNLEEVSYLCNLRDFSKNYTSTIKGKCLITKDFWWKCPTESSIEPYLKNLDYIKKIYTDKSTINAYDYNLLGNKAHQISLNPVKEMKAQKTDSEIKHFKESFEKTDKALLATREFILNNDNISEFDIAKNLEENFYKFGAKSLSFKPIVAKDKNSALAHYSKSSKEEILQEGSLVLIDCGAYYEGGYATDITRVFIKGNPSELQKTIYTSVLKGFLKAFFKKTSKTTTGFSLDKSARELLNEIKPEGFEFSHSLGHGLGISVHEAPPSLSCSPLAKHAIKPNMCFTIEPGLYNPEHFGVRLENSCYLEEKNNELKIKSFTNMCFEKNLIDFELLTEKEKEHLKTFTVK